MTSARRRTADDDLIEQSVHKPSRSAAATALPVSLWRHGDDISAWTSTPPSAVRAAVL